MDQREFDAIWPALEKLEAEKDAINLQFQDPSTDHETLKKLSRRMAELVQEIEQQEIRWMELAETIT
jgi:predicted  nucleic acid-binding Zn-ribbon protein